MSNQLHTVVVAGVIFNTRGQVLLTRRRGGEFDGIWNLPGGRLENEQPHLGLERELMEEVGVRPTGGALTPVTFKWDFTGDGRQFLLLYFAGYTHDSPANLEPDKCYEVKFFALNGLPDRMFPREQGVIRSARRFL